MTLRFFRSGNLYPPPTTESFSCDMSYDARAADRQKRNARIICKKKPRNTVTLSIFVLAAHAPLISSSSDYSQMFAQQSEFFGASDASAAGSPVAATRLIRANNSSCFSSPLSPSSPASPFALAPAAAAAGTTDPSSPHTTSSTNNKFSVFCTVPPDFTPAQVIEQLAGDLERFQKRRLARPCDYFALHPALEDGSLDPFNRRALHGTAGAIMEGIGRFPFAPLALVPCVFAADRQVIEDKTEPQRRMVIYHARLQMAQHLGRLSRLMKEMSNHAHGTTMRWIAEWKALKNREVDERTGILFRATAQRELQERAAMVHDEARTFYIMKNFHSDICEFFDDGVFFVRRSNAAFEATRVIMARAKTECVQRIACRERWEKLLQFYSSLWATTQRRVQDVFTESRLRLEIVTATAGRELRSDELMMSEKFNAEEQQHDDGDTDEASRQQQQQRRRSPPLRRTTSLLAGLKCSVVNSSLGATAHAVQEARTRRRHAMFLARASGGGSSNVARSDLCTVGVVCGDSLASSIAPEFHASSEKR